MVLHEAGLSVSAHTSTRSRSSVQQLPARLSNRRCHSPFHERMAGHRSRCARFLRPGIWCQYCGVCARRRRWRRYHPATSDANRARAPGGRLSPSSSSSSLCKYAGKSSRPRSYNFPFSGSCAVVICQHLQEGLPVCQAEPGGKHNLFQLFKCFSNFPNASSWLNSMIFQVVDQFPFDLGQDALILEIVIG